MTDWVRRRQGGTFKFSVAALTFYAYFFAFALGCLWAMWKGRRTMEQLKRPDLLWRFVLTASLFTAGDMLSFASMRYLDPGTFSLVGKCLNIVLTVFMTRLILQRKQSPLQYTLVAAIAVSAFLFCHQESLARARSANLGRMLDGLELRQSSQADWPLGLFYRVVAAFMLTLAAVLQERVLSKEPSLPFMLQQCWMGCGSIGTSLIAMRFWHGHKALYQMMRPMHNGFSDWTVVLLLILYIANGMAAGLMVKHVGALTKALCVPVYLGGCYAYSVACGSAVMSVGAIAAWAACTVFILLFGITKAFPGRIPKCLLSA